MKSELILKKLFSFDKTDQWLLNYLLDEGFQQHSVENNEYFEFEINGITGYGHNRSFYRFVINPLKIRKYDVKLFGLSTIWVDAIEYMGFHDFLFFIQKYQIDASRVFLVTSICHEPIIHIPNPKIILEFSSEDPHKLTEMLIHLKNEFPYGNYGEISVTGMKF